MLLFISCIASRLSSFSVFPSSTFTLSLDVFSSICKVLFFFFFPFVIFIDIKEVRKGEKRWAKRDF